MKTNQQRGYRRVLGANSLLMFTFGMMLTCAHQGRAQQPWSTPDPNNDIYKTPSSGNVGKVGIGTTAPTELLHIKKDHNWNTMVLVENSSSVSGAQANFRAVNDTNGITQLGVYGSATNYGSLLGNESYQYSNRNLVLMADNDYAVMKFTTGGPTERMRIDASGRVGIGTSGPLYKIHIFGANANPSLGAVAGIMAIDGGTSTNQLWVRNGYERLSGHGGSSTRSAY